MARTTCFRLTAAGLLVGASLAGGVACVPCSATPAAAGVGDSPQTSTGSDKQSPPKDEKLQEEIKKLIEQLGDRSFAVREKATARLKEIGVPALKGLYGAEESTNMEMRQRAMSIAKWMHAAHDLPVRVNGATFRLVVDPVWELAKGSDTSPVSMSLELTNTTRRPLSFWLRRATWVVLTDSRGQKLRVDGGTDSFMADAAAAVQSGETYKFAFKAAIRRVGENCRFICTDPFDWSFVYSDLAEGQYQLGIIYENAVQISDSAVPCWKGKAETKMVDITLRLHPR